MRIDRRGFLGIAGGSVAGAMIPACIREALAIPASSETKSIADVQHVVILMQENRAFDHYFGTLRGVRGFGDRFTIPLPEDRTVWQQHDSFGVEVLPYHLDGSAGNAQRVDGTPHGWLDAHGAWNQGRTGYWPQYKERQSMGYYREAELPFQFALANAFTICDAYHCAIHSSTNPNRLFMFTGTNGPGGDGGGPAIDNTNDDLGPSADGYTWTTYAERLQAAGISWNVYQDMADNFTDNSLEGFKTFRAAYESDPASPLVTRGLSSSLSNNDLQGLRDDVLAGLLPQVSYVVAPAAYSEHTGPSSPVQGAWYTQQVIEALTASPEVFSKTVLLLMFDENDGFFDHLPPPCAPSVDLLGRKAGASTVDDSSERHGSGLVYGPGPRVPMLVISPWSRGGWVNSQAFDHTSIIRFLERRFGVAEPNISAWRRAVCGDLTSAFNFDSPNDEALPALPAQTREQADALRASQEALAQIVAPTGDAGSLPQQASGTRPSRALPYELHVGSKVDAATRRVRLVFANSGAAGAVFHVYDRRALSQLPRRYTVEAGKMLADDWSGNLLDGAYDLWVLGPNGFHRHFVGNAQGATSEVAACYEVGQGELQLTLKNSGSTTQRMTITALAYRSDGPWTVDVPAGQQLEKSWALQDSGCWYDFSVSAADAAAFTRRFAGRIETGRHGVSDPAMATG
ncbi:phosphocholine-specific phospholipase C [Hydrocarboniphaga sp.]|uniref:phosphocholine-specific phospholipase C n=1 Tax=Hydrocarboniphaga sp. TaxID=2033016 RepID=UPI003D15034B